MLYSTAESAVAARAAEDEILGLLGRARGGDAEALPELRAALDGHPELWRAYGDLGRHAREAWIGLIGGPDLALQESLGRKVAAMLDELAGPGAPPLERLLAERVVATWLEANYADAAAAQAAGASPKQASFALKRQESAHRRHLMSIGALATLRKLLPATVEISTPEPVAALSDSERVDVPAEGDVVRPADGTGDRPEAARGESSEAAPVIPFRPRRGAARVRGA